MTNKYPRTIEFYDEIKEKHIQIGPFIYKRDYILEKLNISNELSNDDIREMIKLEEYSDTPIKKMLINDLITIMDEIDNRYSNIEMMLVS